MLGVQKQNNTRRNDTISGGFDYEIGAGFKSVFIVLLLLGVGRSRQEADLQNGKELHLRFIVFSLSCTTHNGIRNSQKTSGVGPTALNFSRPSMAVLYGSGENDVRPRHFGTDRRPGGRVERGASDFKLLVNHLSSIGLVGYFFHRSRIAVATITAANNRRSLWCEFDGVPRGDELR